jgi:hypothetical protein
MSGIRYTEITTDFVEILKANRCSALNWKDVYTGPGFRPENIRDVTFSGIVKIGGHDSRLNLPSGSAVQSGIYNARLHNTTIGNNVYISNIGSEIANMEIGDNCIIQSTNSIVCKGMSMFGNGERSNVVVEAGGREVILYDCLSSQVAYLLAMYRHREKFLSRMDSIINDYCNGKKSKTGYIGNKTYINGCGELSNIRVGEGAQLSGCLRLTNGTIASSVKAPAIVGSGVIADNFIILESSHVNDSAILSNSFMGQGVRISRQFNADNSLFFANSEAYQGESVSVLGGPYTVTHHKSTLLIAGYYSFYNAGSCTNHSNHMYKLGPLHQGIVERGCKTGSFSYLMWPARIGAFTVILGRHYAGFDTSDFPFSYIKDEDGKSVLLPAMNMFNVGTVRDGAKWPVRDRRESELKTDLINFNIFSPYTVQKMMTARKLLRQFIEKQDKKHRYVHYKGINIKTVMLKTYMQIYESGIYLYLGNKILERLEQKSAGDVLAGAEGVPGIGTGRWIDVNGMICPQQRIESLISEIECGKTGDINSIQNTMRDIFNEYNKDEWAWVSAAWKEINGKSLAEEGRNGLKKVIEQWSRAADRYFSAILADSEKEYKGSSLTGFGIDGEPEADFKAVRGNYDDNVFVRDIREQIKDKELRFKRLMSKI